jgi:hypothetical protein
MWMVFVAGFTKFLKVIAINQVLIIKNFQSTGSSILFHFLLRFSKDFQIKLISLFLSFTLPANTHFVKQILWVLEY